MLAQRDDLMPHEPSDVRRLAEAGISYHVQISETREPQCFADPVAASFLDVTEQLHILCHSNSREERKHARTGVLGLGRKTIHA